MALITLKEALSHASKDGYAIGAFNIDNHDSTEGVMAAAEDRNVPVILSLAEGHFKIVEMEYFMPYLMDRIKGSPVPVVLNLDHGRSYEGMIQAIHYGFSSIMFDGSKLSFEDNINRTREIVKIAHTADISVEGELGHVAFPDTEGQNIADVVDRSTFTVPEEARRFVEETGVDALAVAIGTVHGSFKGDPNLDYELLETIDKTVPIPLVLHGGTGLSPEDFRKSIKHGIRKINYCTGLVQVALDEVNRKLKENPSKLTFAKLTMAARKRIAEEAGVQMDIFGTMAIK